MKLKGGVLTYVLFIGTVVLIIMMSFIVMSYYNTLFRVDMGGKIEALRNLNSSVEWVLAKGRDMPYGQKELMDFYGTAITVQKQSWGLYDLYVNKVEEVRMPYILTFFVGYERDSIGKSALYLADQGHGLSLVGNTKIEGDAYLPQAGLRAGFIGRNGYQNEKLIEGRELRSKGMPVLAEDGFRDFFFHNSSSSASGGSNHRSFTLETDKRSMIDFALSDTISGKIHIDALGKVVLDSLSRIENCVVSAKVIEFRNGFTGYGQFFAEDSIIVGAGARIDYPSVLMISGSRDGSILLDSASVSSGMVVLETPLNGLDVQRLTIKESAVLNGMAYCAGQTDLSGTINGHLSTNEFVVVNDRGVFRNYIQDGKVKSDEHLGLYPIGWGVSANAGIMQWLD